MEFGKKYSVNAFKAMHNCDVLTAVKNPKTGLNFVEANGKTLSAISKNYKQDKPSEFVEMLIPALGDKPAHIIMCLHNPSEANVLFTL